MTSCRLIDTLCALQYLQKGLHHVVHMLCLSLVWITKASCRHMLCLRLRCLTVWHHMRLTIPADLWGLITHILVYLWGLLLAGGMTEKEIASYVQHKLPLDLRLNISNNLSRALSCLRLSGHNFLAHRMRHNRNGRPYDSGSVTIVTTGTLFRMRTHFDGLCMNIWLAFAHSTASWFSHLSMRIAQLVWGLFWTSQICTVWPLLWLSA